MSAYVGDGSELTWDDVKMIVDSKHEGLLFLVDTYKEDRVSNHWHYRLKRRYEGQPQIGVDSYLLCSRLEHHPFVGRRTQARSPNGTGQRTTTGSREAGYAFVL